MVVVTYIALLPQYVVHLYTFPLRLTTTMSGPEPRILESTIGMPPASDLVMSSSLVTFERSRRRREDDVCVRTSKALEGVAIHPDGPTADEICRIGVSNTKDGDPTGLNTTFPDLSELKREMSERNMST